ncbi:hypothetical protein [Geodermatophilus obscurus]|uniref:hypothetical protein n=1 Tax=Geodermatophilus obscurus TaxID=1861 RepID=UPI001140C794|nr:hypothetical protein [Geodermatophilus obscurus]
MATWCGGPQITIGRRCALHHPEVAGVTAETVDQRSAPAVEDVEHCGDVLHVTHQSETGTSATRGLQPGTPGQPGSCEPDIEVVLVRGAAEVGDEIDVDGVLFVKICSTHASIEARDSRSSKYDVGHLWQCGKGHDIAGLEVECDRDGGLRT